MGIRHTTAVEYRAPDAEAIRERWWRRCVASVGILCVFGFILSAFSWGISATDINPHAVSIEFGEQTLGVGISSHYTQQTYWYWKRSDVFPFHVEIPLWLLTAGFAVGCVAVWLLRRRIRREAAAGQIKVSYSK